MSREKVVDFIRKTKDELLEECRADNLRLVAENLKLRTQRRRLKNAFARFARKVHK
jgi:membrane-bound ClpP family serine protease